MLRKISDEDASEFECQHEWRSLGKLSGFFACETCGQVGKITIEFDYLLWTTEPLEGHV